MIDPAPSASLPRSHHQSASSTEVATLSSSLASQSHILSNNNLIDSSERSSANQASHLIAPRLIIPPSTNMLSPPNPLITQLVPFSVEEGEGIVPSTPILYSSHFGESTISPQVPQSQFVFSTNSGVNTNSRNNSNGNSITPTISDTVSSVITIDDAVAEYESNSLLTTSSEANQEEEQVSLPTSSDAISLQYDQPDDTNNSNQERQQQPQPTSGILSRPRKLRIRGSSRGRL